MSRDLDRIDHVAYALIRDGWGRYSDDGGYDGYRPIMYRKNQFAAWVSYFVKDAKFICLVAVHYKASTSDVWVCAITGICPSYEAAEATAKDTTDELLKQIFGECSHAK